MCPLLSPHEGSLPAPLIPQRSAPQARCPLTAGGQGPVGPLGRTPISFTGFHPPGPSPSQPPLLVLSPWRLGLVKRGRRHCPWHCGPCLRSGLGTLGTLSLSQPPGFWAGLSVATPGSGRGSPAGDFLPLLGNVPAVRRALVVSPAGGRLKGRSLHVVQSCLSLVGSFPLTTPAVPHASLRSGGAPCSLQFPPIQDNLFPIHKYSVDSANR